MREWTSGPLHGRRSRPCARYLLTSACTDVEPRLLSSYRSRFVGFASRDPDHCDGPPGHHCINRDGQHCFLLPLPYHRLHSRDLLLVLSRILVLALRPSRSCLSMPPGIFLPRWRLAIAQVAVRGTFLRP